MSEKTDNQKVRLPMVPLRDIVVFPFMVIPLFVGREKSVKALEQAMEENKNIFLSTQRNAGHNDPAPGEIYETGTIANILQVLKLTDGTMKVLVEGVQRARISEFAPNKEFLEVEVIRIDENIQVTPDVKGLMRSIETTFEQYVKLNQKIPLEAVSAIANLKEPHQFADTVAAYLTFATQDKQDLLDTYNPADRLNKILNSLKSEMEILKIEKRVHGRVRKQMERSQREFYLNEQMKAIQKELGKRDEFKSDIDELMGKVKKAKMPKDIHEKTMKELRRLEAMQPMSAEATVVRNYIDWLVDVPWNKNVKAKKIDLKEAYQVLDEDHYGLEKVKERIVEHLAVMKLVKKMKGPILCLVGPPGVGKTSLGKSIARATGRPFVRVSLGGVRDEAEIRGHRRTYIGALPGKIIQGMKKAGAMNPVFLLDEVDKMSMDFRGDPSAALLEVLDPEQNCTFNDHFLEVDYDLSQVLFICTANVLEAIPTPLKDRMEVIRLPGYTEIEKLAIAENFLLPKKIEDHGLAKKNVKLGPKAIKEVIRLYTREAGVRNLEREIGTLCRKVAMEVVEKGKRTVVEVKPGQLSKFLGIAKFSRDPEQHEGEVGVVTGLAWTEFGGELLSIEVALTPGKGQLVLTGKLGDVMKESAQAALSYVRKRYARFKLAKDFYQKIDIHIHIPEGAIPKDGPSAGITMAVALISALTDIPPRHDLTMTGEVTLTGRVLAIGGLKEKALAANRVGFKEVIIPEENEKDIPDIPESIRKQIQFHPVKNMDEVIALSFPKAFSKSKKKTPGKKSASSKSSSRRPSVSHLN